MGSLKGYIFITAQQQLPERQNSYSSPAFQAAVGGCTTAGCAIAYLRL
ncbi:MAG: hypothetical protein LBS80_00710 [Tannerella sp.]|nr:hypothetical protein [Tannerella sp.]